MDTWENLGRAGNSALCGEAVRPSKSRDSELGLRRRVQVPRQTVWMWMGEEGRLRQREQCIHIEGSGKSVKLDLRRGECKAVSLGKMRLGGIQTHTLK